MYEEQEACWTTPGGHAARFLFRADTNDWNVLSSITTADEYGLAELGELTGWALDLGAHIGGVAVSLALDHPALHVLAVEPVLDNVLLALRNSALNDVAERVLVLPGAVGPPGLATVLVRYGFSGSAAAEHNAFVGNSSLAYLSGPETPHREREAACFDLSRLCRPLRDPPVLVKIDCEGGEWGFLTDPAVASLPRIVGEWHPVQGHVLQDLLDLLEPSHAVSVTGPTAGPGGFVAVRHGD